jgi:hypothetical protein
MIVGAIERHRTCPAGMSVEIRSTSGGDWEAVALPPPRQNVAYADCADYIRRVAKAFRSLYRVQLTPDQLSSGVPAGSIESHDDTADIARMTAERQRRSIAATQSGVTDAVPLDPPASTHTQRLRPLD